MARHQHGLPVVLVQLSHAGSTRWRAGPRPSDTFHQMVTEGRQHCDGGAGPLHQARPFRKLSRLWKREEAEPTFDKFPKFFAGTKLPVPPHQHRLGQFWHSNLRANLDPAVYIAKEIKVWWRKPEQTSKPSLSIYSNYFMGTVLFNFQQILFSAEANMRGFCASYVESSLLKREVWNWVKSANDNIGQCLSNRWTP